MKKYAGFNAGQRGDLVMCTVAAKTLKTLEPDCYLSFGMSREYGDMFHMFENHPYIDNVHFWEKYDNWPTEKDKELIKTFDYVFNAMPPHAAPLGDRWFTKYHQCQETVLMQGLPLILDDYSCILSNNILSHVKKEKKMVAFAPFAGWYNPNNSKKLSFEKAQQIVDFLTNKGFYILLVGGNNEPRMNSTIKTEGTYTQSLIQCLGCDFYIGTDTGMSWALSAYQFPSIGLYSNQYYTKEFIKNIQPINKNAIYLDAPNVNDILIEDIETAIKNLIGD